MSKNNVLKNSQRQAQINLDKAKYSRGIQTEYDRLGVEPIKRGEGPKLSRQIPFVPPGPRRNLVPNDEPEPDRVRIQGQDDYDSFHNQIGLATGRKEHTWLPETEEVDDPNVEFGYDEIPDLRVPNRASTQPESRPITSSLADIENGQYVLCRSGKLIFISDSLEEVEQIIDELVFSQNYNVDLNDLKVFRCLEIKAGIVVKG